MKTRIIIALLPFAFALSITSCSSFEDATDPYNVSEAVKDLSGKWLLKKVTRNNVEITNEMDFSQFTLNLNVDGTYSISNYLPFVVQDTGSWTTDNPAFPFLLSFKQNNTAKSVDVQLHYPIINGARALSITLSPGCYSNTYTYTLERINQ